MRIRKRPNHSSIPTQDHGEDINLTPLIDMVFILLIFFLVTTSFIRASSIEVQRPRALTATQTNAGLLITISANQQIWLNNTRTDLRLLPKRLGEMRISNPSASVIILADSQTPTGLLVHVTDKVQQAGFVKLSVAAQTTSYR